MVIRSNKISRRALLAGLGSLLVLGACKAAPISGSSIAQGGRTKYRALPLDPEEAAGTELVREQQEWADLLSPLQYRVMRKEGTERAFTGEYYDTTIEGLYHCAACGNPLFSSETKYDSGTGWPSFWAPLSETFIEEELDRGFGMNWIEVLCARCDSHLGHVFEDGPPPTGLRYCMNSIALNLVEA